jgi:hypothetical protein
MTASGQEGSRRIIGYLVQTEYRPVSNDITNQRRIIRSISAAGIFSILKRAKGEVPVQHFPRPLDGISCRTPRCL